MRKAKCRGVKWFTWSHTAGKWKSWTLNLGPRRSGSGVMVFSTALHSPLYWMVQVRLNFPSSSPKSCRCHTGRYKGTGQGVMSSASHRECLHGHQASWQWPSLSPWNQEGRNELQPQFPRIQATLRLSHVLVPALTPDPRCCDLSSVSPALLVSKHFGYTGNRGKVSFTVSRY